MKAKHKGGPVAIVLAFGIVAGGCGSGSKADPASPPAVRTAGVAKVDPASSAGASTPPAPGPSGPRATNRPANLNGKVFIVEYHHIRSGKGDYFRTTEEFRADLERLYKDGFRPCTVSQYLENKMDMPPGATPAVFTFDDATPSQIQLLPDGSVDPTCAVGIWMDFAKTHPDFPVRATFFVLPDTMWGQRKMRDQKVALIRKLGCELGNHTVTHPILKRLSDERVKGEIAVADDDLEKLGVQLPVPIALPFGVSPKNKQLLKDFDYKGKHYHQTAALLVGAEPAPSPTDPKLNRYRIPRIQAYNGPFGLPYWLDKFEKGQVKVYVSP